MESDPKIIVSKANPGFKLNPVLDQKERDTILCQGAEGRIYLSELWGVECIVKERFKKEYRVPILDERLTKARILSEVKSMNRIRKLGVPTPAIYLVDEKARKIYMEYLGDHSLTVKDFIRQLDDLSHPAFNWLTDKIAKNLNDMHRGDVIHGDLTTSNMMIVPNMPMLQVINNQPQQMTAREIVDNAQGGDIGSLNFIDFGLSSVSGKAEDKAVDIYVLKRAFISTHPGTEAIFDRILEKYKELMSGGPGKNEGKGNQIMAKFKEVEGRGRKRECFG